LFGKGKKGKGKNAQSNPKSIQNNGRKKDLRKIKCFNYHEFEHYATKCPHNKSNRKPSGGARGEALASQFELDFTLIACMASTMMGSMWYLDLGALFHMIGSKQFFHSLEEKDLHMHIELGDDGWYSTKGIGNITFKRELLSHLHLKDVIYVPRFKNNLISIELLEDHGYDVVFSKGRPF